MLAKIRYYTKRLTINFSINLTCLGSRIFLLFSGQDINQVYFPILVPVGVIGNILSFLVRNKNLKLNVIKTLRS